MKYLILALVVSLASCNSTPSDTQMLYDRTVDTMKRQTKLLKLGLQEQDLYLGDPVNRARADRYVDSIINANVQTIRRADSLERLLSQ